MRIRLKVIPVIVLSLFWLPQRIMMKNISSRFWQVWLSVIKVLLLFLKLNVYKVLQILFFLSNYFSFCHSLSSICFASLFHSINSFFQLSFILRSLKSFFLHCCFFFLFVFLSILLNFIFIFFQKWINVSI